MRPDLGDEDEPHHAEAVEGEAAIRMNLPPMRSDIRPATGARNIDTIEDGAITRPASSALKPSTDCR